MSLEINQKAPAFKLKNSKGETVELKDFLGKYLVLYFYPKDDTPGCTKQACSFRELNEQFTQLNACVLGISPDEEGSHIKFIDKYNLNFDLLCDPSHKTMQAYGAWGEKNMYGKISQGVIRSTVLLDPQGKIIKHWKRVTKAEQHPAKVLEVLQKHLKQQSFGH